MTPEQQVGGDDEPPGGSEPDQQRHRQRHHPARDQHPLAPEPFGEITGGQVRERLRSAESDDESEDRGGRGETEVLLADQRQHASLQADHAADERIQCDEQPELAGVRAQTEPDRRRHAGAATVPERFAATIRSCSSGRGGTSESRASANASGSASASSGL